MIQEKNGSMMAHLYTICIECADVVALWMLLLTLSSLVHCGDVNCVNYTVSQKKISNIFSHNLSEHCPIVIFFGRNVT